MKYVILIHADPQPWGHPTGDLTAEGRAMSPAEHAERGAAFDALMAELEESGELVTALALAAPAASTVYRWASGGPVATDGPYAETKEQLAGFFLIDCATRARAEEIAERIAHPGDVIELRPGMEG
ncbi:YciI family protein [Cellulomonas soli]|uniref:YciI family protein n=1 Tax=Cellulomonas soli TaxID=931535 RepID=UPI003F86BBEB